jgi:hypothetical protein
MSSHIIRVTVLQHDSQDNTAYFMAASLNLACLINGIERKGKKRKKKKRVLFSRKM